MQYCMLSLKQLHRHAVLSVESKTTLNPCNAACRVYNYSIPMQRYVLCDFIAPLISTF